MSRERRGRLLGLLTSLLFGALSTLGLVGATATWGQIAPIEDWARYERVSYGQGPLRVHLRTGYQRPLIMPEAIRLERTAIGADALHIEIDTEVLILSPLHHFAPADLVLIGLTSGTRYRAIVRASATGSRIPVVVNR